jgi:peptidoglycan/LPS O-acetylase OafA/YrhL
LASPANDAKPRAASQDAAVVPSYHPSLDGLRALAVLLVVFGHAGYRGWLPLMPGMATIGVVLFFFLSGFLMAHHYLPHTSLGVFNRYAVRYWSAFTLRRFIRVYPPYIFVLVLGYVLLQPLLPPDFGRNAEVDGISFFTALIKLARFSGDLGIYWTVEIELIFYLIYPFAIALSLLLARTKLVLLLITAAFIGLNHFADELGQVIPVPSFLETQSGYLAIFFAGALTSALQRGFRRSVASGWRPSWNSQVLAGLLGLSAVTSFVSRSSPTQASIWQMDWLFAIIFFVIFTSLIRSDGVVNSMLSSRPCVAIGRASFSLYLIHIIAFQVTTELFPPQLQGIAAAFLVLLVMTTGFYFFCERPFVMMCKRIKVTA